MRRDVSLNIQMWNVGSDRKRARSRIIRQHGHRSALFGILKQEHPIKTCSSIRVLRETGVDILRGRAIVFHSINFFFS